MIRRVWIPKASGGQRGLGIPNVVDRVVQEAVRMALDPLYDPTFHASSHGFRKGRSCHTAIAQARQYVEDGFEWVVDLDLEKFFDRVSHQRLMARLSQRVPDRDVLALISRMLRARVVLPDGVVVSNDEGGSRKEARSLRCSATSCSTSLTASSTGAACTSSATPTIATSSCAVNGPGRG